jgi:hypothetical protein
VELDHFFTSLIRKDAAGGLTLLTNTGAEGACGSGRLSPPMGPSPAYSLPPSPFRNFLGCFEFHLAKGGRKGRFFLKNVLSKVMRNL